MKGIFLLLAGIILIFGIVNYLNILSLSILYPKYFGFLPHKQTSLQANPNYTPAVAKYFCPAPIHPCQGKEIFKDNRSIGLGFKVDNDGPIFAIIPGELSYDEISSEAAMMTATIAGKGNAKGYLATYNFVGKKTGDKDIREVLGGELAGTALSGSFVLKKPEYRGINLIFKLQDQNGRVVPLTPSDFQ